MPIHFFHTYVQHLLLLSCLPHEQIAGALHHLHSHSIIYQDLKPGNVLLWQFPKPEMQWDSDSVIHVKLADYGVCQMDTAQGVKGMQGTPSYLPPEVLLQGGKLSHNSKLDVYSFGMFLYFLFTFTNPFEKEMRTVAFLLEEGKRPEFSPQVSNAPIMLNMLTTLAHHLKC